MLCFIDLNMNNWANFFFSMERRFHSKNNTCTTGQNLTMYKRFRTLADLNWWICKGIKQICIQCGKSCGAPELAKSIKWDSPALTDYFLYVPELHDH